MIEWMHPGWVFLAGALALRWVPERLQSGYRLLVPAVGGMALWGSSLGVHGAYSFLGRDLIFGRVDRLSVLFGTIFVIMAFVGAVYGLHEKRKVTPVAAFLYVGGALGVVFAGDLVTVFIFSEVMAFSSVFLIWSQGGAGAIGAGFRYILVHISGGVCLLGGLVIRLVSTGSAVFEPMALGEPGSYLILAGFLVNAAVPPLSAWLSDAYPEATVTGAVFLSAFTTKTAVYTLIRGFPGTEVLVWLGAGMAIYGVVYAVLENDMRRLLAYHIISQVGYMVAGVGMGTALALNGSSAHAFAHILYKGLLFMGAGAVIEMTGRRKLTELGGLYKTMPITLILYMIGAFSISAFPLFSGFVSKSMVVSAAAENHRGAIWLMLTLASAGTFLHTGLKLPYYAFFWKDSGIRASEPPGNMLWAMGLAALMCIGIGVVPGVLYGLLPYPVAYAPYTAEHVVGTLQILLFTGLGFMLLLKQLDPERTVSLDTDWFYRKGGRGVLWLATHPIAAADAKLGEAYLAAILRPLRRFGGRLGIFDLRIVDGAVNSVGGMTQVGAAFSTGFEKYVIYGFVNVTGYANHRAAAILRKLQSGLVHHYAALLVIGLFILVNLYLWLIDDTALAFILSRLSLSGKN